MRLFTAIELPEAERRRLPELGSRREIFGSDGARLRWVRPETLHLTLTFLGEVSDGDVPRVCDALKGVPKPGQITLGVTGVDFLPPRGPIRVFVADVGGDVERLSALHASIEQALEPLGFTREARAFRPHVTIARSRRGHKVPGIVRELARKHPIARGDPFRVDAFVLFQSHLKPAGPEYVPVARFAL
jgi:2'-5' RNA ligase